MEENFEKDFLEVERKFEVDKWIDMKVFKDNASEIYKIYQGYFVDSDGKYKRIRLQTSLLTGENKSVICEKIQVGTIGNIPLLKEIEVDHNYQFGINLINSKNISCIEKTRYVVPFAGFNMEVDKFENLTGEFNNWRSAEVEFKNEKELEKFKHVELPEFILRELTGDKKFSNANMSKYIDKEKKMPFLNIKKHKP